MFANLTNRIGNIFEGLKGKGSLTEDNIAEALREIRVALLEADVALPVVKDFIERVKVKAIGQEIIRSVSPAQQIVKIVHDEMVELLGSTNSELNLNAVPPVVFLMVGLQGSGKTTSTAKIARMLTEKQRKKILMASLDTQRPAAQDQLAQLGTQNNIVTLEIIKGQTPVEITARALDVAKIGGFDVLILDTAGRLSIDDELMREVATVKSLAQPLETLLVVDAMTGQDAVNTAQNFDDRVGITGIVLTRIDGDARGGAALSMRAVTGKPIKLMGTGEKSDALEPFHPDRIAGRILDMGDVVSLVERALETIDQDSAAGMAEKFQKGGSFDLNDMLAQFRQMKRMGGMGSVMKMLPGLNKFSDQIEGANLDDGILKRQEAIILSMTTGERVKPNVLNASRRRRIAVGSGTTVQDVNKLIKQYEQMEQMMRKIRKMGMGGLLGAVKGFMSKDDQDKLDEARESENMPAFNPKFMRGGHNKKRKKK